MPIIVAAGPLSRRYQLTPKIQHSGAPDLRECRQLALRGLYLGAPPPRAQGSASPRRPRATASAGERRRWNLLPLTYPALHHELHASKSGNVSSRIAVERGEIGEQAGLDRADAVAHA